MKYIREYKEFLDTIDFSDVTNDKIKMSRSKPLNEEAFIKLFNDNCKNFNFNNTQLYRGVSLKHNTDLFLIEPTGEKGDRGQSYMKDSIKKAQYNIKLKEDPQFKDLPDRNKSIIVSNHPKGAMVSISSGHVKGTDIQEEITFIIIPFDYVKIAVAPIIDLHAFKSIKPVEDMERNDFLLLKYNKSFKIPNSPSFPATETLEMKNTKEVWTEGPCLLVRYSSLDKLKELVKQRS